MFFFTHIAQLSAVALFLSSAALLADDLFVDPSMLPSVPFDAGQGGAGSLSKVATDSQKLQEVVENQLAAIRSFDTSRAYYAYTTKEFQKAVSLESFKLFVKKFSVLFRNKQATQEGVSFKGGEAFYKGKFIAVDGEAYNVNIVLVLVDEEWKIHSLSIEQPQQRRGPLR